MPSLPTADLSPSSKTRLPALPIGWQAISHAILGDGTLAVLATDVDIIGESRRISTAFEASISPDPPPRLDALSATATAQIWTAAPSSWIEGPTCPLETPFALFDRFSDGRWLVVAPRSLGEANARVLSSDGVMIDRFMLGDGIEYVGIDAADRIWVGWFDEGIFGDLDWRVPGYERPPSSNGVACFTSDGTLMACPEWPEDAGIIADCYALNVAGPSAWACPYTEFPLVRFLSGEPARWWRCTLSGPKAIAVNGSHALVAGGYLAEANRLTLVALEGDGRGDYARPLASWALPLRRMPPSAEEWAPIWGHPILLAGRGDTLHLVDEGVWYRWRVGDVIARLE